MNRRIRDTAVGAVLLAMSPEAADANEFYVSGYGNAHYMDHRGAARVVGAPSLNDGFFQLREFSLFMDFVVTESILASAEIEIGENGNRFTANYAYVDIRASDQLSFRLGRLLVPFLAYNESKPNFKQHLMSQPFTAWNLAPVNGVALSFGGFGWSDSGLMMQWSHLAGDRAAIDLRLALINGLGSSSDVLDDNTLRLDAGGVQPVIRPRDGLLQNERAVELRDVNADKAKVAKLTVKSVQHPLDVGLSWYRGDWDPRGRHALTMVGGHLNWLATEWTLKGEIVAAAVEQEAGLDPVAAAGLVGPAAINTSTGDYGMRAWYAEATRVAWRGADDRSVRLVARYDDVDTNDEIPFTPFDRSRITVGGEWELAVNCRLRYEWQRSTIDSFERAPGPYRSAGGKEHIQMHMASVIFAF